MIMPIAEFVTYMKSIICIFFTVESTAQTACDWYEGSMVIPSYFLYVQLLWKQGVHVTVRFA